MNIKSVIFGVKKERISKLVMSTMFSTLMANSFGMKREYINVPVMSRSGIENTEINKLQSEYKFGIDENLGYASKVSSFSDGLQVEEKTSTNELAKTISEMRSNQLLEKSTVNTQNNINSSNNSNSQKENKPQVISSNSSSKVNSKKQCSSGKIKSNKSKTNCSENCSKVSANVKKANEVKSQSRTSEISTKKPVESAKTSSPNTKVVNGQTYTVKKTISGGNATAYSIYGKTSTGWTTFAPGDCYCVAVDPKQIPYYSDILIEFSDGRIVKGKALDTGSALKSHHKGVVVDLYMKTESECRNFGRRNVTVYVV